MKTASFVGIAVALAIGGCAKDPPDPFAGRPAPSEKDQASVSDYVSGMNEAGFKLLGKLADGKPAKNVLVSPYSASQTLGMLGYATTGETQKELLAFLGASSSDDLVGGQYGLAFTLNQIPERPFLSANAVITLKGNKVAAMPKLADRFLAEKFDEKDLSDLLDKVNNYASEKTLGMIPRAVDELDPDVAVVLVNASAFNAKWKTEFLPSMTRKDSFTLEGKDKGRVRDEGGHWMESRVAGGKTISVPFLYAIDYPAERIVRDDGWSVAKLPYVGDSTSMVFALPPIGTPLSEAVGLLSPEKWKDLTSGLDADEFTVLMPKFKFTQKHDIKKVLLSLGVTKPFEWDGDYLELVSVKGPSTTSDLLQAVSVEVDEQGTKAAAATVAKVAAKGMVWSFNLNRPFIYAIEHNETGAILFIGVCADPSQSD